MLAAESWGLCREVEPLFPIAAYGAITKSIALGGETLFFLPILVELPLVGEGGGVIFFFLAPPLPGLASKPLLLFSLQALGHHPNPFLPFSQTPLGFQENKVLSSLFLAQPLGLLSDELLPFVP